MADPEQKVEEEESGMDATPDDFFDRVAGCVRGGRRKRHEGVSRRRPAACLYLQIHRAARPGLLPVYLTVFFVLSQAVLGRFFLFF